ncbi:MAG: ribosomal L7Ae/L30e/S12e/Gadd45 family protein [Nanoarchaeota archaeon]|nr:ribosomal L7Ae/L30e/S12e/Gadd45 family protein [Nanoarchaeota archaeon]
MVEIDEKQVFAILQKAKDTGAIKIGANEVTKAVERAQAKLVVTANDVSPAEIVAHFPGLCKEMKILFSQAGSKMELGASVGIKTTTAVAVIDAGSAAKELEALIKEQAEEKKAAAPKKEEAKVEAKVEEKKEKTEAKKEVKKEAKEK